MNLRDLKPSPLELSFPELLELVKARRLARRTYKPRASKRKNHAPKPSQIDFTKFTLSQQLQMLKKLKDAGALEEE